MASQRIDVCFGKPLERMEMCESTKAPHMDVTLLNTVNRVTWRGPGARIKHMGTLAKPSCLRICCMLFFRLNGTVQNGLHAYLVDATELYLS